MLVPNLIVINYPKPTTGANALTPRINICIFVGRERKIS
jgi:hypothetical protein